MRDDEEQIRGMERLSLTAQNAERIREHDRERVLDRKLDKELRPSRWARFRRRLRRDPS